MQTLITIIFFWTCMHPIHISKCNLEVNPESKQMEIVVHVYIDDLEEIIEKSGAPALRLATAAESTLADSFIMAYVRQHLLISNGGKQINYSWIGKEQSDDLVAFWCFLETEPVDESESISITYSVLQDLYADQQNILFIKGADGEEAFFLSRKSDNQFTFN